MGWMFEPTKRKLPGFATGYESPAMQRARLQRTQEALKKAEEARTRREAMETFREVEARQQPRAKPKYKPVAAPIPPRAEEDIDLEEEHQYRPGLKLVRVGPPVGPARWDWVETDDEVEAGHEVGTQHRFEQLVDEDSDAYEDTYGQRPVFGSNAYKGIQAHARETWREEQKHIPDSVIADREGAGDMYLRGRAYRESGLFVRSDEMRQDMPREPSGTDSKYGIVRDELVEDTATLIEQTYPGISRGNAMEHAQESIDVGLGELEQMLLEDDPDMSPEELREQMYGTVRVQQLLTEVLDEWEMPRDEDIEPPAGAVDEAIRRYELEVGDFFGAPEHKTFLGGLLQGASSLFNTKFIPTFDPSKGFEPTFASMDDAFRGGAVISRPVAQRMLPVIAAPFLAGEETFEAVTGIESHGVSGAIRGQIAEDILTEVINPAGICMAIPFIGWGTRGLRGGRLAAQITANLLGTGVEPGLMRGTLRGLTLVAKNPSLLKQVPRLIRETPTFQRGYQAILEVRAGERGPFPWLGEVRPRLSSRAERVLSNVQSGRPVGVSDNALREIAKAEGIESAGRSREGLIQALADKQQLRILRADDPTVFRRVVREMVNEVDTHPSNLPLRKAIENEMVAGRSFEDILETGLRTRPVNLKLGEYATVYHGASSLDESTILGRGLGTESPVFVDRRLAEAQATTASRILGGEERVFALRMKKADLLAAKGRPSGYFTTTKLGRSATVSRMADDTLSPALRAVVHSERAGGELVFNTIRGPLNEEFRALKTAVQEGLATPAQVERATLLHRLLSAGDAGFADTLKTLAAGELGLKIPRGASPERIASKVMETVDEAVSPWGVARMWGDEQGSFRLGREAVTPVEKRDLLVNKALRNAAAGDAPGVRVDKLEDAVKHRAGGLTGQEYSRGFGNRAHQAALSNEATVSELLDMERTGMLARGLEESTGETMVARIQNANSEALEATLRAIPGVIVPDAPSLTGLKKLARQTYKAGERAANSARHRKVWDVEKLIETFSHGEGFGAGTGRATPRHLTSIEGKEALAEAFTGSVARDRLRAKERYVKLIDEELGALKVPGTEEYTNLTRASKLGADKKHAEWAWELNEAARAGDTVTVNRLRDGLGDNIKQLVKEHRGTLDERLARLDASVANQLRDETEAILNMRNVAGEDLLSVAQKEHYRESILQKTLDSLPVHGKEALPVFDSGRQLETLISVFVPGKMVSKTDMNRAFGALRTLTNKGHTPTAKQLAAMRRLLDPVFGRKLTQELLNARKITTRAGEWGMNAIGMPRALMASSDLSAMLRQGAVLGPANLGRWAEMMKVSWGSFINPDYARAAQQNIRRGQGAVTYGGKQVEVYDLARNMGIDLTSEATESGVIGASLYSMEERYMTQWAEKLGLVNWVGPVRKGAKVPGRGLIPIPGVPLRESSRAYATALDTQRLGVFGDHVRSWAKAGVLDSIGDEGLQMYATFINNATGRGNLPGFLRSAGPGLNALFFAPKLVASRVLLVRDAYRAARALAPGGITALRPVAGTVLGTLAADIAAASSLLLMAELGGKAAGLDMHVGVSPFILDDDGKLVRFNSDFGKIRWGNTRFDIWTGYTPLARYTAGAVAVALNPALKEAGLNVLAGNAFTLGDIGRQALRSKLSPIAGLLDQTVISGHDYAGKAFEWNARDIVDALLQRTLPLSWQNPLEAIQAANGELDSEVSFPDSFSAVTDALSSAKNLSVEDVGTVVAATVGEGAGIGAMSYVRPGEKLADARAEAGDALNLGHDYNDPEHSSPATRKVVDSQPNVQTVKEEIDQKYLDDGREWAVAADEEATELKSIIATGKLRDGKTVITDWTQKDIDDQLERGDIDGAGWIDRHGNIEQNLSVWNKAHKEDYEFPDETSEQGKAIEAFWDIQRIDFQDTQTGDIDNDAYWEAKDEAKAAAIATQVDGEVDKYFASFEADDTDVEKRYRAASRERDKFEEMPRYVAGVGEADVAKILDDVKETLLLGGSSWGKARYIQWLWYQGEQYQTNAYACAFWVAYGAPEMVVNKERDAMILGGMVEGEIVEGNPDLVLFYNGMFRGLSEEGQQAFLDKYRSFPFSKSLQEYIEERVQKGELSLEPTGDSAIDALESMRQRV